MPIFGGQEKVGFSQNIAASMINDQNISENYAAGFIMSELHVGKWLMLLPGIRYENTRDTMLGFKAIQPTLPGPIFEPLPGDSTSASRQDEFWLPMMHLRITPSQYFYAHFAYTNTLNRPDFNAISPNVYVNTGFAPFTYVATNPALKSEFWKNYDAQFTLHSNKIGLVSVSGFYKTVKDKIWYRSYKRLKGDPIIDPFPDNALVNVSNYENHQFPIFLKGFEVEVQTGFWYLPKPFKFLTINANYTYTDSETKYPLSKVVNVVPPGGGRPVATRIDSTATGPMLFQPKHIVNLSLGFNRKGLNVWLSFQYNGMIFTGKNFQLDALDPMKEHYYRWDLQIAQKLSKKLTGWEIVANLANLSNFAEVSRLRGDPRPTYMEQFGWTADLGLRYRF
jgi:TonB-dependent receptor